MRGHIASLRNEGKISDAKRLEMEAAWTASTPVSSSRPRSEQGD